MATHHWKKTILSKKIITNIQSERKKRSITDKNTDGTLLPFKLATVTGNCRWKIYNKFQVGQNHEMSESKTYTPGWIIRSIELIL